MNWSSRCSPGSRRLAAGCMAAIGKSACGRLTFRPRCGDEPKDSGRPFRMRVKSLFAAAATFLALSGVIGRAEAQTYPSRVITLVIPFAPGGSTSIVGTVIADKMGQILGQNIILDHRPGAGGTVGSKYVSKAEPDGYTLLLGYTGTLAIGPSLYKDVGYDPRKDFAPIGMIGNAPSALVVHPSFPAATVAALIAFAKA